MLATLASDVIHLHPQDNLVVSARALRAGEEISAGGRTAQLDRDVKMGHKVAIEPIAKGQKVLKYGQVIGLATRDIAAGEHIHSHNLAQSEWERDPAPATETPPAPPPIHDAKFMGFRRAGGRAGTRNYIAVISTVNCSASVAKYISRRFDAKSLEDYPNVDGIVAITHQGGCGMSFGGPAHQMLNRTLGGIARHPNIGAFLLVGLGCEQGAMGYLLQDQRLVEIDGVSSNGGGRRGPIVMSMQDLGGTAKTIEAGVRAVAELLPRANATRREPIGASEIILATECGGSDGYSGITANPATGVAADRIVACGGTAVLSETTEIYGAEHLLTRRARSKEVAQKLLDRIEWWKWYTSVFGAEMDNNPSVGNKEGGLTTIAEKSLDAVAKGGSMAMEAVYEYAEPITAKGFVVMDTPGYDPASVVGLVAGGCNVMVFTTGRGSCFGCKPTPSIKVATNTPMYERMIDDMDVDAGKILAGASVEEVGEEIFQKVLSVASGEKTKSELLGIGDEEFVPWLVGPTL